MKFSRIPVFRIDIHIAIMSNFSIEDVTKQLINSNHQDAFNLATNALKSTHILCSVLAFIFIFFISKNNIEKCKKSNREEEKEDTTSCDATMKNIRQAKILINVCLTLDIFFSFYLTHSFCFRCANT